MNKKEHLLILFHCQANLVVAREIYLLTFVFQLFYQHHN